MGSPRCTATTEMASVPTAATAPQARTESGFVIFGQTLSARLMAQIVGTDVGADCPSSIVANLLLRRNHNPAIRSATCLTTFWAGAVLVILCFFRTTANRASGTSSGSPCAGVHQGFRLISYLHRSEK